ncbi:MAG: hypothetical protein KDK91_18720 [Gammaproteobacteria bacterium]|nr:hypothetical protein [Gammaproteobacteria bacterium]
MRSWHALLVKELRQHGALALVLGLLLALAFAVSWLQLANAPRSLSRFELVSGFASLPLVIAALVLAHRLVVMEQRAGTQRFIESLPLPRGRMELVKYTLGLGCLLLLASLAMVACAALAADHEPLDGRFLAIMTARLWGFVFALWSLVFMMGFLGRLRAVAYAAIVVGVYALDSASVFEFRRFGPMAAIDPASFGLERYRWPLRTLVECLLLGASCSAMAFGLAMVREGAFSERLGRPMTPRDKAFALSFAFIAALLASNVDAPAEREPHAFVGEQVIRVDSGRVVVAYLEREHRSAALALAETLSQRLRSLRTLLRLDSLPVLRVALTPDVAADRFDTVWSNRRDGLLLTANFDPERGAERRPSAGQDSTSEVQDPDFVAADFVAYAIHEVLAALSNERLLLESRHWLTDGFARYWADHGAAPPAALGAHLERQVLKALVAVRDTGSEEMRLRRWDQTAETLGNPQADALAYLALRVLREAHGADAFSATMRAALSLPAHGDLRDWWFERRNPLSTQLERATGWTLADLSSRLGVVAARLAHGQPYASVLAAVPTGTARFELGAGADLRYELRLAPPPDEGDHCRFMHRDIGPVDWPGDIYDMQVSERGWPRGATRFTHLEPGSYGGGTRLLLAVDCVLSVLDGPLRVGVARLLVPSPGETPEAADDAGLAARIPPRPSMVAGLPDPALSTGSPLKMPIR